VAGVAAELDECGIERGGGEQGAEALLCESAGERDAGSAGGGEVILLRKEGLEAGLEEMQEADLQATSEWGEGLAGGASPCEFKRVADGGDSATLCDVEDGAGDRREEMRVFVRVNVGDVYASTLEFLDLGLGLAGEVCRADGAAQDGLGEVQCGGAEGLAVSAEQRGYIERVRDGDAIYKDEVTACAEGGGGDGEGGGLLKRGASGHEGGGGKDSSLVEFKDGAVNSGCEAEVVSVDDEARGHSAIVVCGDFAGMVSGLRG